MERLPVELITQVAFLACRDGGYTGASLSLVSKNIRDACHPARFYTVSLASCPERFSLFMEAYQAQLSRLPDTTPRVRHLFLSLLPIEGEPMYRIPALPYSEMFRAYDKYLASLRQLGETYGAGLCDVVRALAPDLETLAFVRGQWKGVDKLDVSFPRLRELTLVDSCPEFLRIEDVPLEQAPIFPALERLHTVEHFYARPMDFRQWAPHAPVLTHLRCSGLHYHNSPTAVSLQEIATHPIPAEDGTNTNESENPSCADIKGVPFPFLRRVLVQPTSTHSNPAYPYTGQRTLRADLEACAQKARRGLHFSVLPDCVALLTRLVDERRAGAASAATPAADGGTGAGTSNEKDVAEPAPARCIRRAREEWLARIDGREGCWSEEYAF